MAAYSSDLRQRIDAAHRAGASSAEVAKRFGVSASFVRKLSWLRRHHGSIEPRPRTQGRKPVLSEGQRDRLYELAAARPDLTCRELKTRLRLRCCDATVWRELKKAGFSFKRSHSELANNSATTCSVSVGAGAAE